MSRSAADQRTTDRRHAGRLVWSLVAGCVAPTGGYAGPGVDTTTEIRLRYDYKAVESTTGARGLLRRIEAAASEACGASSFSLFEIKMATRRSRCWRDAVDAAVRQIDSPTHSAVIRGARP